MKGQDQRGRPAIRPEGGISFLESIPFRQVAKIHTILSFATQVLLFAVP